jgi:hypothetical protein
MVCVPERWAVSWIRLLAGMMLTAFDEAGLGGVRIGNAAGNPGGAGDAPALKSSPDALRSAASSA